MFFTIVTPIVRDACFDIVCGSNAECLSGVCICLKGYQGNPLVSCRPECVLNTECPRNLACISQKCADPCPGTCGLNALCEVYNHIPNCRCPEGMQGNPFVQCQAVQSKNFAI